MGTRYAKGKKSFAISDRGGQRVRYTQLKTTWDNLRVAPDEWEPKHPQLSPPRNVIDAVALFNPRPDNDPEVVTFNVGFNYDPFLPKLERPNVGMSGLGAAGHILRVELNILLEPAGVAGTGAVGTETPMASIEEAGVAGTGGVGVEIPVVEVTGVSGSGGAGSVGVEALNLSILETGVGGTGGVGNEVVEFSINLPAGGVGGTGGVGTEALELSITETGVGGTGAVGTEQAQANGWSQGSWGQGGWNDG